MSPADPATREQLLNPWPAITLVTLAMVIWFGFQTYQLVRQRDALQSARSAQEPTIAQAQKVRGQLDSIAKSTLELAQQGNSGAALIVEELARRGVTINPKPPTGPVPAAPSK